MRRFARMMSSDNRQNWRKWWPWLASLLIWLFNLIWNIAGGGSLRRICGPTVHDVSEIEVLALPPPGASVSSPFEAHLIPRGSHFPPHPLRNHSRIGCAFGGVGGDVWVPLLCDACEGFRGKWRLGSKGGDGVGERGKWPKWW